MRRFRVFLVFLAGMMLAGCGLFPEPPLSPPTEAPALSASFGAFPDSIALSWPSVSGATTYKIFRAEREEGPYAPIAEMSRPEYSDNVGEENQGKWYWYKVLACNAAGCGPESSPARGYAGRPPKPENVQASQGTYPDKIVIFWDPMPGATHYHVFRDRVPDGTYSHIVAQNIPENAVEDEKVNPATWYWYKVVACNDFGCSVLSEAAGGYCGSYPIPFGALEDAE